MKQPTKRWLGAAFAALLAPVLCIADTLKPGPYTVTDIGSPLHANTLAQEVMFETSNQQLHLLMNYIVGRYTLFPQQIAHINLTTGQVRLFEGAIGRPSTNGPAFVDDKVYLASSHGGQLIEYNAATGAVTPLGLLSQSGAQRLVVGDDGAIYIGAYGGGGGQPAGSGGGVERYDPSTGVRTNYGPMDPAFVGLQYAHSLGADRRYIYVGLGQQPWYLAIYDTQTGSRELKWKAENDTSGVVYKGVNGGWYYIRHNKAKNNLKKYYRLVEGEAVEIPKSEFPETVPSYQLGNLALGSENFEAVYGCKVRLDNAYPTNLNAGTASWSWQLSGAPHWQEATLSGFRVEPVKTRRLYRVDADYMLGFPDFYGPVFLFNPETQVSMELGRSEYNFYDALVTSNYPRYPIFLAGYTAVTMQYHLTLPWSLTQSTPDPGAPGVNPLHLGYTGAIAGKYHLYLAQDASGTIYTGVHHERDSTGGSLAWYHPATGAKGGDRDTFINDDIKDVIVVEAGTKVVVSTEAVGREGAGKIFIMDAASKTILRSFNCPTGHVHSGKLAEAESGYVFGVAADRMYKINTTTGEVVFNESLGGQAFGASSNSLERRLVRGPDRRLWMFINNDLYRIDERYGGSRQYVLSMPSASSIAFSGVDLYFLGSSIKVIRGMFVDTTKPKKVTNLVAEPASTQEIDLSWDAAVDNVRTVAYHVYRNGSLVDVCEEILYRDHGLSTGTQYSYQVRAVDAAGNASDFGVARTAATLP